MAPDLLQEGSGGSSLSEGVVLKLWLHSKHLVWEDHGRHCFLPFSSVALPISATPTSSPPSRRQAAPAALLSECQPLTGWTGYSCPDMSPHLASLKTVRLEGNLSPAPWPSSFLEPPCPTPPSTWVTASRLLSASQPLNPDLFLSRTS